MWQRDQLHIGTSGWTYDDWNGLFYPAGVRGSDRLLYYAERYDTVEVNATFYRFPTGAMLNAWNSRLPPGFRLAVKGSRLITHMKKLKDCAKILEDFLSRVLSLARLDVLLWQLPPRLALDIPRLEAFLDRLPRHVRHAIEFRHPSWWCDPAAALLQARNMAFVAVSHPELPPALVDTADFFYVRFHGLGPELYRYYYSDAELAAWTETLRAKAAGRDTYVYFNNDYDAHALVNANTLRRQLMPAPPPARAPDHSARPSPDLSHGRA